MKNLLLMIMFSFIIIFQSCGNNKISENIDVDTVRIDTIKGVTNINKDSLVIDYMNNLVSNEISSADTAFEVPFLSVVKDRKTYTYDVDNQGYPGEQMTECGSQISFNINKKNITINYRDTILNNSVENYVSKRYIGHNVIANNKIMFDCSILSGEVKKGRFLYLICSLPVNSNFVCNSLSDYNNDRNEYLSWKYTKSYERFVYYDENWDGKIHSCYKREIYDQSIIDRQEEKERKIFQKLVEDADRYADEEIRQQEKLLERKRKYERLEKLKKMNSSSSPNPFL